GTNLFFAIYYDEKKKKRVFETIPLNEVIAHQKQVANLSKAERTPIQPDKTKGNFLFSLSPNDLVYVPTDEELENKSLVDFNNLSKEQNSRVYKMVSSSNSQCFFIRNDIAKPIYNKKEFSALNKMEKDIEDYMIKERCWKLNINRIGNVKTQL
ncbi:MAG: type II CRISPR RNA-guided endonuclease Cas9, partial [Flavobacteriales bacterium]